MITRQAQNALRRQADEFIAEHCRPTAIERAAMRWGLDPCAVFHVGFHPFAVAVTPGSSTFNSGATNFTVPAYNTLTVELWGPGAGGCGLNTLTYVVGTIGSATTCSTLSLSAGPGQNPATTGNSAGGAGGTASGGNTTNTNGNAGSTGAAAATTSSGAGGTAPSGSDAGGAGGTSATTSPGNNVPVNGHAGSAPGGGGSGSVESFGIPISASKSGGGGGSGAYVKSVYVRGVTAGAPNIGDNLAYSVGAGGTSSGSNPGGAGAAGRIKFTWA